MGKWENGKTGKTGKMGIGELGNWMPRTNTDRLGIPLATEEYGHTLTFLPLGRLPLG